MVVITYMLETLETTGLATVQEWTKDIEWFIFSENPICNCTGNEEKSRKDELRY